MTGTRPRSRKEMREGHFMWKRDVVDRVGFSPAYELCFPTYYYGTPRLAP